MTANDQIGHHCKHDFCWLCKGPWDGTNDTATGHKLSCGYHPLYESDEDNDVDDDDDESDDESEEQDDESMAEGTDNDAEGNAGHDSDRDSSSGSSGPTDFQRLHDAFSDDPQLNDHETLMRDDGSEDADMDLDDPVSLLQSVVADVVDTWRPPRWTAINVDYTDELPDNTEMPDL